MFKMPSLSNFVYCVDCNNVTTANYSDKMHTFLFIKELRGAKSLAGTLSFNAPSAD